MFVWTWSDFMSDIKCSVKLDTQKINELIGNMETSMQEVAKEIEEDLIEREVIPYRTGNLESSLKIQGTKLSMDTPYANRLYYHPELNFNKEHNSNAGALWFEKYKDGKYLVESFKKHF
jgi:hypothetical protein